MKGLLRIVVGLCAYACASSALADYESETLHSKGAWSVEVTYNTQTGVFWCNAETSNRSGQTFALTAYDDNTLTVFFFDPRWNLTPRPIRFLIDVDYDRWTVSGSANDISVSVELSDNADGREFLLDLIRGNAVALFNTDLQRLATFSLNGSAAAIGVLAECWDKILVTADPFQSSSDPFGN